MSVFGIFLVRIFPHLYCIRKDTEYIFVFSPNLGNKGPEKHQIRTLFMQCSTFIKKFLRLVWFCMFKILTW